MSVMEIAIEIGTSYTSIFLSGNGIVLREPTVIAFTGDAKSKRVRAVGTVAAEMLGKTPERTTVVTPVVDGYITDADACGILLREFVKKILPQSYIFRPRIRAILGVPTGLTIDERGRYEDVCITAGIADVTMVENIILSGVGIDLPISSGVGLVCNIGGGTTEIAAMSMSGIISGCSVSIGGNMMDKALIDMIVGRHDLKVGISTAKKIKHEIGSLYENDTSQMLVTGRSVKTKSTGSAVVSALDVCETLKPYYMRIAEAIESVINACSPEVTGELNRVGVHLVGGGSTILGVSEMFENHLGIEVNVVEEPSYAVILGAGKLLGDKAFLEEILSQK